LGVGVELHYLDAPALRLDEGPEESLGLGDERAIDGSAHSLTVRSGVVW
jgi:hypothetical protein